MQDVMGKPGMSSNDMRRVDIDHNDGSLDNMMFHLARYKFIARLVKKTDRLAEVGCGTGYGARFLSDYVKEVVASDLDQEVLAKAKSRFQKENLHYTTSLDSSVSYDVIVSLEVIEHMSKEEGVELLKFIASHLKEGGVAFISTPRKIPNPSLNRQLHHVHEYHFEEFREALESVFARALIFTQIDEVIATHHHNCAWNFVACCYK